MDSKDFAFALFSAAFQIQTAVTNTTVSSGSARKDYVQGPYDSEVKKCAVINGPK